MPELYNHCSNLNFAPFEFQDVTVVSINDDIDPDRNVYNRVDSLYYSNDEFNFNFAQKGHESSNFSIISFNIRSMSANFDKLKCCISSLHYKFDIISVSETWMSDNDGTYLSIDGYNSIYISRDQKIGGGVALYVNESLQHNVLKVH